MAKGIYVGVDSKARKVTKAYIGVDNKARKVKKGYIGVAGVARPFFSAERKVMYYGKATDLSAGKYFPPTANAGDYAVIGPVGSPFGVDAYNSSLVRSNPANASYQSSWNFGASVGGYALFPVSKSESEYAVNAYSSSLVKSNAASLSTPRYYLQGTQNGSYAMFAGGFRNYTNGSGRTYLNNVDAYKPNLTRVNAGSLSRQQQLGGAANIRDYMIFAGGSIYTQSTKAYTYYNTVYAYTSNLTYSNPTALSTSRDNMGSASVGDYVLFAGGVSSSGASSTVDAYNSNLVRSTVTALSKARVMPHGTSLNKEFALFAGGYYDSITGTVYNTVDVYDANLVRSSIDNLSVARGGVGAISTGDYALFAGGHGGGNAQSVVDVYQLV